MQKLEGVADIRTDVENRLCNFKILRSNKDYPAKLAEMAESNTHLAGFEIQ